MRERKAARLTDAHYTTPDPNINNFLSRALDRKPRTPITLQPNADTNVRDADTKLYDVNPSQGNRFR